MQGQTESRLATGARQRKELVQRLAAYEDTGLEPEEILGGRAVECVLIGY